MLLTQDEIKQVKVDVTYTNDVKSRAGYVEVSLDNKVYYKEDIYVREHKSVLARIKEGILKFFS